MVVKTLVKLANRGLAFTICTVPAALVATALVLGVLDNSWTVLQAIPLGASVLIVWIVVILLLTRNPDH